MNSEVTLEQLRGLSDKATPGEWTHSVEDHDIGRGMVTRRSVVVGGDGENIIRLGYPSDDCAFIAACVNEIRRQLTTPPASGEVVGVPREAQACMKCSGRGWITAHHDIDDMGRGIGEIEDCPECSWNAPVGATLADAADDESLTLPIARELLRDAAKGIYAGSYSAAPKQAMGWRDIESAPEVKGKYFWCFLAWGAEDDQSIGEGFRYDGKWYAAATFYQAGKRHDERQYFWREQEVNPTHWQELPSPPEKATDGAL